MRGSQVSSNCCLSPNRGNASEWQGLKKWVSDSGMPATSVLRAWTFGIIVQDVGVTGEMYFKYYEDYGTLSHSEVKTEE